ncbi:MAG: NAD(+)/NADH kinase [Chloroflexota bacterium]|nr:MAG: NAD(+)/NADH kinase [Chloroflexota bacterium]
MKRVGILYHPKIEKAEAFSQELGKFLKARGVSFWTCSAWEEEKAKSQISGSELILSIGGDGTILRAVRAVIPQAVPIVGINLGNLGFMTELKAEEALDKMPRLLDGKGWVEDRTVLEAEMPSQDKVFNAINDVFVGRRSFARLVRIETRVNGEVLATHRADGVILATATGSTGYSLASGGPILCPQAKEIIFKPVCPHLALDRAVVLPPDAQIQLKVTTTHEAMISIDGQVELPLNSGDEVKIRCSPHVARFLRIRPKAYFYSYLESRLKGSI